MNFKVPIPIYQSDSYDEIVSVSSDGNKLEANWESWNIGHARRRTQLESMGLQVVEIVILPGPLKKYCTKNDLEINGKSRASFAKIISEDKT